jgi:hypothetical protein
MIGLYGTGPIGAELAHNFIQGNSYLRANPPAAFYVYVNTAFDGQFGVTQLINGYATNASIAISTSGANQLDNWQFVTNSLRNVQANATTNHTSIADGPGFLCNGNTALHWDLLDFIQFRPSGGGNLFVTLATTKWHVYAATELVPVPGTTNFDYSPLPPPMWLPANPGDANIDTSPTDSQAFPFWASVLTNLYSQ